RATAATGLSINVLSHCSIDDIRVIFHPEGQAEMIEQARYYERKSASLGSDFLDAVEETTYRIQQSPAAGTVDRANIRKASSPDFRLQFFRSPARSNLCRRPDAPTSATCVLTEAG